MLISAHRYANRVDGVALARAQGADFVEVDVHLYRGRLEARHEKTLGPIPLMWDRHQRPVWNPPRLAFEDVLSAAPEGTVFHLDLKGWTRRLSRQVIAALGDREYVVSSRVWWLLPPFHGRPGVLVVRSIGARWQLRWFRRWGSEGAFDGVAIRSDMLTPAVARDLKRHGRRLFVWRVHSQAQVDELESLGADVLILDDATGFAASR